MTRGDPSALLTLEPLIDAVRTGVEEGGWTLSGLQKTTSHQFEGRWSGDATRSAYLFFHDDGDLPVSVDVYLDETTRGLTGNLALVVDLKELGRLGDVPALLAELGRAAAAELPDGYRCPLTFRLRMDHGASDPADAEAEVRFKLTIPRSAIRAGASAVAALCSTTVGAFQGVLASDSVRDRMSAD